MIFGLLLRKLLTRLRTFYQWEYNHAAESANERPWTKLGSPGGYLLEWVKEVLKFVFSSFSDVTLLWFIELDLIHILLTQLFCLEKN